MAPSPLSPPGWRLFVGHAVAVLTLALGGLSSFHALRAEVVELRAVVQGLAHTEADHTQRQQRSVEDSEHRREGEFAELRQEIRDLRGELRELKSQLLKGAGRP